ncbi:MAG TPA: site-specific DNA-methyltransferase [Anaerolineae bacterium]|nr:site-specific DNA-methyltransferase [Anaerolineae bacterium]
MQTNVIYCADARHMVHIPDDSVHLVVTSPPYNVNKRYENHNDNLPLDQYLAFLSAVWRECYRVLVPGGRLCINVANTNRKPYLSLVSAIDEQLRQAEEVWLHRGHIIWDKAASVGISTAWGSFARASNPILRDVHEYITIWSKQTLRLEEGGPTGITGGQFVEWTRSIWRPEEGLEGGDWELGNGSWKSREGEGELEGEGEKKLSLAELQRKMTEKLAYARRRGKDDVWIAESLTRAAWQYFSRPGPTLWRMVTASGIDHPTPFPVELPKRLILLYTSPGDVVLDPFMGSGSTAIAARLTGRHYIGYEISEEYCRLAEERLKAWR